MRKLWREIELTIFSAIVMLLIMTGAVYATPITGSLIWEGEGGVEVTSPWDAPETVLTWEVTSLGGDMWSYGYTFTVPEAMPVSNFYIQTSDLFGIGNIFVSDPSNGVVDAWDLGHSLLYGIGFEKLSCFVCAFSFTSDVAPMWGSFAAQGLNEAGEIAIAYNSNIGTVSDFPITGRAPDGLLLVPGAPREPTGTIPEPSTLYLVGMAGLALFYRQRRV
ncbi:MAG: PEP-CTERM sorting domain-containing protein [Minisyncoccia bacterium]